MGVMCVINICIYNKHVQGGAIKGPQYREYSLKTLKLTYWRCCSARCSVNREMWAVKCMIKCNI